MGASTALGKRMQTLYSRQKPVQVASSHPVANSRNLFCSLADEELALQSPVSERVIAWRRFKVNWNKVCQSRHLHCVHIRGPNSSLIRLEHGIGCDCDPIIASDSYAACWRKTWAAREVAAGSVLHAIDVGLKGQAIRTSINPGKSSCKKHLTWYTKSCCFRHKRTWHRLTQCLYMSIRIVFYNRIAPVFSRSLLDLFWQACNMYILYIYIYYEVLSNQYTKSYLAVRSCDDVRAWASNFQNRKFRTVWNWVDIE